MASKKIYKNIGGRLAVLTSIVLLDVHVSNFRGNCMQWGMVCVPNGWFNSPNAMLD